MIQRITSVTVKLRLHPALQQIKCAVIRQCFVMPEQTESSISWTLPTESGTTVSIARDWRYRSGLPTADRLTDRVGVLICEVEQNKSAAGKEKDGKREEREALMITLAILLSHNLSSPPSPGAFCSGARVWVMAQPFSSSWHATQSIRASFSHFERLPSGGAGPEEPNESSDTTIDVLSASH